MSREPYPAFEPLVFEPIDTDMTTPRIVWRGLVLLGLIALILGWLLA